MTDYIFTSPSWESVVDNVIFANSSLAVYDQWWEKGKVGPTVSFLVTTSDQHFSRKAPQSTWKLIAGEDLIR